MTHCRRCHECGSVLRVVLDGEEWCPNCLTYRRYRSHGWTPPLYDPDPCPEWPRRQHEDVDRLSRQPVGADHDTRGA